MADSDAFYEIVEEAVQDVAVISCAVLNLPNFLEYFNKKKDPTEKLIAALQQIKVDIISAFNEEALRLRFGVVYAIALDCYRDQKRIKEGLKTPQRRLTSMPLKQLQLASPRLH